MDRLFLDANILFSAAYRANAGLLQFWKLKNVALCSSHYALEEARINLVQNVQKRRLERLARAIEFLDRIPHGLPRDVTLPDKDAPILRAAIAARATHLAGTSIRPSKACSFLRPPTTSGELASSHGVDFCCCFVSLRRSRPKVGFQPFRRSVRGLH